MSSRRQLGFSTQDDERLIELVRDNPPLYVVHSKGYKNKSQKEHIWAEIAREMCKNSEDCKLRWKNIRDHYHRKGKVAEGGVPIPTSNLHDVKFELLKFLNPVFNQRRNVNSLAQSEEPVEPTLYMGVEALCHDQIESSEDNKSNVLVPHYETNPHSRLSPEHIEVAPDITDSESILGTSPENSLLRLKNKSWIRRQDREGRFDDWHNQPYHRIQRSESQGRRKEEHVDIFLKGIGATMKHFPPSLIAEAKRKIFIVVSDLELSLAKNGGGSFEG